MIQRVTHRRVEQIWQAYKQTGVPPTLKTPGKPKGPPVRLHEAVLVLKVYDELKVNALTLERVLRDIYQVELPHNRIHMILKEAGRALPQPSKQRRSKWVRHEREHSMSLWHMNWKQLSDGRWWIAAMDDASRLIVGYGVFQDPTAKNRYLVSWSCVRAAFVCFGLSARPAAWLPQRPARLCLEHVREIVGPGLKTQIKPEEVG